MFVQIAEEHFVNLDLVARIEKVARRSPPAATGSAASRRLLSSASMFKARSAKQRFLCDQCSLPAVVTTELSLHTFFGEPNVHNPRLYRRHHHPRHSGRT
jgi:hypothetical protein